MSQENEKFSKMSPEIRILIRNGIYSFYQFVDGTNSGSYLLVTNSQRFYILSSDGCIVKELDSTPSDNLRKASVDTPVTSYPGRKLNYA